MAFAHVASLRKDRKARTDSSLFAKHDEIERGVSLWSSRLFAFAAPFFHPPSEIPSHMVKCVCVVYRGWRVQKWRSSGTFSDVRFPVSIVMCRGSNPAREYHGASWEAWRFVLPTTLN